MGRPERLGLHAGRGGRRVGDGGAVRRGQGARPGRRSPNCGQTKSPWPSADLGCREDYRSVFERGPDRTRAEVRRPSTKRTGAVPGRDERRQLMPSPRRLIAITAACALLAGVGGFVAASFVLSPAESAARAAPPPAGPISVPVTRDGAALAGGHPRRRQLFRPGPGHHSRRFGYPGADRTGSRGRRRGHRGHGARRGQRSAGDRSRRSAAQLPDPGAGQHRARTSGSCRRRWPGSATAPARSTASTTGRWRPRSRRCTRRSATRRPPRRRRPPPRWMRPSSGSRPPRSRWTTRMRRWTAAGKGPSRSAQLAADAAVNAAAAALTQAQGETPADPAAVEAAEDQLDIAKAQRAEVEPTPDTSQQESALEAAAAGTGRGAGSPRPKPKPRWPRRCRTARWCT